MSDQNVIRRAFRGAYERAGRPAPAAYKERDTAVLSGPGRPAPMRDDAKSWAATARVPLGTLGDLRIPYGIPHGSIVEYQAERLRTLHWPWTMATLRDALERAEPR